MIGLLVGHRSHPVRWGDTKLGGSCQTQDIQGCCIILTPYIKWSEFNYMMSDIGCNTTPLYLSRFSALRTHTRDSFYIFFYLRKWHEPCKGLIDLLISIHPSPRCRRDIQRYRGSCVKWPIITNNGPSFWTGRGHLAFPAIIYEYFLYLHKIRIHTFL